MTTMTVIRHVESHGVVGIVVHVTTPNQNYYWFQTYVPQGEVHTLLNISEPYRTAQGAIRAFETWLNERSQ